MGLFSALSEEFLTLVHSGINSVSNELIKEPINHKHASEFIDTDKFLSKYNDGFVLDGKRSLSIKSNHVLLIGGSGTGKTVNTVIPSVLKSTHNMIINDPSKEIFLKTASSKQANGYRVLVVNFSDSSKSVSWNPLQRVATRADANKIAKMFVDKYLGQGKDQFWNISASGIISLVIQVQFSLEPSYKTLCNTLHILEKMTFNQSAIDALVARTSDALLIREYSKFISYDSKLRTSILATSCAALSQFSDEEIVKVTSNDTLNIEDLRKDKFVIYLHTDTMDSEYYSVLLSIFFEQTCKLLMSKLPENGDRYVQFIMDEFSSMKLPSIQQVISNCRKFFGNIFLICQDYAQIENIYGNLDAQAIRNNCTSKVFLAGLSYTVANDVSRELGKFEYLDNERYVLRDLLSPEEVRTISADEAILIHGNALPMRLKLTPYYQNPMLRIKTEQLSLEFDGDAQFNEVNLISI